MSKKTIALLVILFAVPVAAYFLWPSDENRIRTLVRDSVAAVEKGDVDGVMSGVSYSYEDNHGLSYLLLKKMFEREFAYNPALTVKYSGLTIDIKGDAATASFDFTVESGAGAGSRLIPVLGKDPVHMKLKLRKEAIKWLITGSEFEDPRGRR